MLGTLLNKLKAAIQVHACRYCNQALATPEARFCPRCKGLLQVLPPQPAPAESDGLSQHAATLLNGRVKKLVYGYKFYQREQDAPLLADLLIHYWAQGSLLQGVHPESVAVIPIPAHEGKRPHLQPIARRFARHFGYETRPEFISWQRATSPQHRLENRHLRRLNVAGSMRATLPADLPQGHPQTVILLDDLTTTGATLDEAVRAMREALPHTGIITLALAQVPRES